MPLVASFRVDWIRVISELSQSGLSLVQIAAKLDIAKSTVHGWKGGVEPRHCDGELLIALWCDETGNQRGNLPMLIHAPTWLFSENANLSDGEIPA